MQHFFCGLKKTYFILIALSLSVALNGCSGFQLRSHTPVAESYHSIYLEGLSIGSPFGRVLGESLQKSGVQLVGSRKKASAIIKIEDLQEDRKVTGYTRERKVREYNIYLKFRYAVTVPDNERYTMQMRPLSVGRNMLYDPDFLLGKAEEEQQLRQEIRKDAARLILLRLKYGQATAKK